MQRVLNPMGKIRNGHYYYAYYSRVVVFFFGFGTSQRLSLPRQIWKRSLTLPAAAQTRRVGLTARAPRYAPLGSMGNLLGEVSGCVRGASRPVFRRGCMQTEGAVHQNLV